MMNIKIKPLEGIEWNGKFISLKCSKEAVEQLFGKADPWENSYYYFDNELRFDFNDKNELEFIEFLGGVEGEIQPEILGINPFSIQADELYSILSEENHGEIDDSESGYSYAFIEISIGIYRENTPKDVLEMIQDAEESNESLSKEELDYEMNKANHWDTIGLGIKGYYSDC